MMLTQTIQVNISIVFNYRDHYGHFIIFQYSQQHTLVARFQDLRHTCDI